MDNLTSYPSGNKVYQFGITSNNTCYIQFPEDIATLIPSGMYIRYIISNGEGGNIKANTLTNFATDLPTNNETSANDSIKIIQASSIINGEDPETLEQAYRNYKKTVGTFNTLVTRRDYENFINRLRETANCVVSDRTSDINYSNYIQEWGPEFDIKTLAVKIDDNNVPYMDAFKVFLYLNKFVNNVNSLPTYTTTFTPDNDAATLLSIEGQMDEIKAVQHDITIPNITSLVFNYNNFYDINGLLYLKYKVTNIEKANIENNVKLALLKKFNAKNLDYGVELDYQAIIDTIMGADDRISNVILSGLDYQTKQRNFANTLTSLNEKDNNDKYIKLNELVARMILAGNVQLYKYEDLFNFEFGQINSTTFDDRIIKSITTGANITVPATGDNPYSIKENEVIELWADNYITTAEYGAYCTVEFISNNSSIPKNELYKLGENEQLQITYSDSNNAQKQKPLTNGTIIETNHNFTVNTPTILTANEYIRVKDINSYKLTSGSNYLALFNRNENVKLEGKTDDPNAIEPYIILQENEYFIYPNSTKTDLVILGMGTKLSNPNSEEITIKNNTEKVEDINKNNIDSLTWDKLEGDLNTTETTTISLGQNVNVYCSETMALNNEDQSLGTNILYYKEDNNTELNEIKSGVQQYYIRSRLNINSISTKAQMLDVGQ